MPIFFSFHGVRHIDCGNINAPAGYIFTDELIYRHGKAAGLRIVDIIGAKKAPLSTIVKAALYATVMAYEKIYGLPN